jgi:endoglucanase
VSKQKLSVGVYAVATVQEEVGLRGAMTSAFGIDPKAGIAVDVTFASDTPSIEKKLVGDVALGKGPVLARGATINPVLEALVEKTAKKRKISFQMSAESRFGRTDAHAIQLVRAGVPVTLISIPNRYMHSSVEVCSLKDMENAAKLIAAVLAEMKPEMDFTP